MFMGETPQEANLWFDSDSLPLLSSFLSSLSVSDFVFIFESLSLTKIKLF